MIVQTWFLFCIDISKKNVGTKKTDMLDWYCWIKNLILIFLRITCFHIVKLPIQKSANAAKPNKRFISLKFVSNKLHNLSSAFCCLKQAILSLMDWFVYVTITWMMPSSRKVHPVSSVSKIWRNSGLTPGRFGIMFWKIMLWWKFWIVLVVVHVIFVLTYLYSFLNEHQPPLSWHYWYQSYHNFASSRNAAILETAYLFRRLWNFLYFHSFWHHHQFALPRLCIPRLLLWQSIFLCYIYQWRI